MKMSATRYFTVQTKESGIDDKLGYQLRILYKVGIACGYEYLHTPISFRRSWKSKSDWFQKIRYGIEQFLLLKCGFRIPQYWLVNAIFNKLISLLDKCFGALFKADDTLTCYLGLDTFDCCITDKPFSAYTIMDIPFEQILETTSITDFAQLNQAIEALTSAHNQVIYRFSADRIYPYISSLRRLLVNSGLGCDYRFLNIAEKYWSARHKWPVSLPFDDEKIKVVIHIRRGDSVVIDLCKRQIFLHGDIVTREEFEKILERDPGRRTIDICKYWSFLRGIFDEFGEDNFSCILISDGYARTFNILLRAIHGGRLILNRDEWKTLRRLIKSADQELSEVFKHRNVYPIIGESNMNLCKSIHALACADIVIYRSSGFAAGVHQLFRRREDSVMIPVEGQTDAYFKQIGAIVAAHCQRRVTQ